MFCVNDIFSAELEVKKSKFISYILPYNQFDTLLRKLKKEHPKARHLVTAYRYLNGKNQIVESFCDDGEPKGTGGKPTLNVLSGHDLINTAIITIRYFGGIKLGTGGLVRAYSDSANLVIESSKTVKYKDEVTKTITFSYEKQRIIEYELQKNNIDILEKNFLDDVTFVIKSDKDNIKRFLVKGLV